MRFEAILVAAVAVPTAALHPVPHSLLAPIGLWAVVLGGAIGVGVAVAAVLRSASTQTGTLPSRGADTCFTASAFCFFTLCFIAPGAAFVGADVWNDHNGVEGRGVLLVFVAGGALAVGAVFALAGLVLAARRDVRMRLALATVDLAVQVLALVGPSVGRRASLRGR